MSRTENLRSTTGFKVFVRLSCILFLAQLPSAVDQLSFSYILRNVVVFALDS
ncbi:hypothetical protein M569_13298 [Genlisea aurea]|uniref:Uncharacterized protein n=1 Tax=Genlisea aurea TaxID=192259 RepID=S8C4B7_9LAMI|nr:hypothetical protein M569_13298 [Genlisea aurea]